MDPFNSSASHFMPSSNYHAPDHASTHPLSMNPASYYASGPYAAHTPVQFAPYAPAFHAHLHPHATTHAAQPPLMDVTQSTLNISMYNPTTAQTSHTPASSKRKQTSDGPATSNEPTSRRNKRARVTQSSNENAPPQLSAVGPQEPANSAPTSLSLRHPALPPSQDSSSTVDQGDGQSAVATDVWYFVRGVAQRERPPGGLPDDEGAFLRKQPNSKEFPFIACRLCLPERWKAYANGPGLTETLRRHFGKAHPREWPEAVLVMRLKNWKEIQRRKDAGIPEAVSPREPFTLEGFYERLIRWIAVDDQSMDVVDTPELRELLRFISPHIDDGDIPHRTKLAEMITAGFQAEYYKMLSDIKNSEGRVSFTTDIWSRQNMDSYMAVTAHFISKNERNELLMDTRLVAFRKLNGSHTGVNIAEEFVKILKEIGCMTKVSMITMDNAGNNQTTMAALESHFSGLGIPFSKEENRIRCFPHVINLAVKAGLKQLTDISADISDEDSEYDDLLFEPITEFADSDYLDALEADVVGKVRKFVAAVRASGQRRAQFRAILIAGNTAGGWGDRGLPMRVVGLLKDVDTRWSSVFLMLERFLETYEVSAKIIEQNEDLAQYRFTDAEIRVLEDVKAFLEMFHCVQQIVSAEKTPTLAIVIPLYEQLISTLTCAGRKELRNLSHAIRASVQKLQSKAIVQAELDAYLKAGYFEVASAVDLLRFWQNHRHIYPHLFRVAMDVLPAQASAVACERVFSSSKETDTNRRSSLGDVKMEQLQLLKFSYRQDRFSFTRDLIYTERELSILDVEPSVVEDLIRRGQIKELDKLIADSWKGWGEVETVVGES